ncbi:MAG: hypothetical protein D6743_12930 [Calditrichaeota bacterium]|nr:MAG: hypothetical protein D6743_12930 [Calditrichota bacterium]
MTQQEKGILGISLIDDQLRIVEGRRQENEFIITGVTQGRTRQPFKFDVFSDKSMPRRFAEDITRLLGTQEFSASDVAFSLDSRMVLVKRLPVDKELQEEALDEQVSWEVGQFAISPLDNYIVDFERLNSSAEAKVEDLLVVVVRKNVVRFLRQVFKQTDLKLKVVDVDIFSAQRALQLNYDYDAAEKIGLIDLEERKINFSILKGRNFFLAQDLQINPNNHGRDSDEATMRLITKELRRIILDQHLGKGVEDLNEIFLYGEAVEDNVLEGLQNSYDVRIERANPFKKVKLQGGAKEGVSGARPERFMISVGAALRGIQ